MAAVVAGVLSLFAVASAVSTAGGNVAAALVMAVALATWARHRRPFASLVPAQVALAFAALLLTQVVATALAPPLPARWDKLVEENWLKLLLVAVPLAAAGSPRAVVRAVQVVVIVGAVAGLYGVWQHFSGFDPIRDRRLHSTVGMTIATGFQSHHLSFGGVTMIALAVAMAWLRHEVLVSPRRAWLPLAACLAIGLGLVGSFARSAQVGAFAAAVFLVLTLAGRWRRAGVALLTVVLVVAALTPAVRLRALEGIQDEKEVTRPNLWRSSVAGIADRPLTGWGPGNFGAMLAAHEVPGFYESRAHSHNDYLMHAVNAGLPALAAALWLLVATLIALHRGWRRGGPGSWIVLGAGAAQVAVAVAGIFQVYQTDDEPEMLLYFVLGCALALIAGDVTPSPDAPPAPGTPRQGRSR